MGNKANGNGQYQVFVSHATADKWIAIALCKAIEAVGGQYFRDDERIESGASIPDEIRKEIRRSKEMVVLLTPESKSRPWVLAEVGAAWMLKRRIICVLCHEKVDAIPEGIKTDKAISINDFDAYTKELSARVMGAVSVPKKVKANLGKKGNIKATKPGTKVSRATPSRKKIGPRRGVR